MKLAAGLMLAVMWSCNALAAAPETLVKAPQAAAPEARMSKPAQKQKIKPVDKVEQKVQEAPKAAVTPEVTEESVQLKGVRG